METSDIIQLFVGGVESLAVIVALVSLVHSNNKMKETTRLDTLQRMVTEMNNLRSIRAADPDLERASFEDRKDWDDNTIKRNIMAVQMASVFEWAYMARRAGQLDKNAWESWQATWRGVILKSEPLRKCFSDTVWTFSRDEKTRSELNALFAEAPQEGEAWPIIKDPYRRSFIDRLLGG